MNVDFTTKIFLLKTVKGGFYANGQKKFLYLVDMPDTGIYIYMEPL